MLAQCWGLLRDWVLHARKSLCDSQAAAHTFNLGLVNIFLIGYSGRLCGGICDAEKSLGWIWKWWVAVSRGAHSAKKIKSLPHNQRVSPDCFGTNFPSMACHRWPGTVVWSCQLGVLVGAMEQAHCDKPVALRTWESRAEGCNSENYSSLGMFSSKQNNN